MKNRDQNINPLDALLHVFPDGSVFVMDEGDKEPVPVRKTDEDDDLRHQLPPNCS